MHDTLRRTVAEVADSHGLLTCVVINGAIRASAHTKAAGSTLLLINKHCSRLYIATERTEFARIDAGGFPALPADNRNIAILMVNTHNPDVCF